MQVNFMDFKIALWRFAQNNNTDRRDKNIELFLPHRKWLQLIVACTTFQITTLPNEIVGFHKHDVQGGTVTGSLDHLSLKIGKKRCVKTE